MNHGITGETVHCCLKASVPLIHVFPPAHPCSPLPALVINPGSAPSLALLSLTMSASRSPDLSPGLLSLSRCLLPPGMTGPMMDHGLQRHIDTHWTDLSASDQALIKGIYQQRLSIKMRRLDMVHPQDRASWLHTPHTHSQSRYLV